MFTREVARAEGSSLRRSAARSRALQQQMCQQGGRAGPYHGRGSTCGPQVRVTQCGRTAPVENPGREVTYPDPTLRRFTM